MQYCRPCSNVKECGNLARCNFMPTFAHRAKNELFNLIYK